MLEFVCDLVLGIWNFRALRGHSPSSGERKGISLNLLNRVFCQFIGGRLKDLGPYVFEELQDSCYYSLEE